MKWLDRLGRKFDRFSIGNLMQYVCLTMAAVWIFSILQPYVPLRSLISLSPYRIRQGQIWRLITFIFEPPGYGLLTPFLILFYYWIGRSLEYYWGTTRFNLYYLFGILGAVPGAFLTGATGTSEYLNLSLLLAWVALFPDMQVLLLGLIPFKLKWLGWIEGVYLALDFLAGSWPSRVALLLSVANFLLFFGPTLWNRLRRSWPRRY